MGWLHIHGVLRALRVLRGRKSDLREREQFEDRLSFMDNRFDFLMDARGVMTKVAITLIVAATAIAVLLLILWIILKQPVTGVLPDTMTTAADPDRLRSHVSFLTTKVFPRNTRHPENLNRAADYIHSHFSEVTDRIAVQAYTAGGVECRNIIAKLGPEQGLPLVIGAHYDVFDDLPGADDNASGVAGLLELSRLLSASGLPYPVELVAFSTEEPPFFRTGQMGSAVHASSLRQQGVEIRGMICFEMIGYFTDQQPAVNPVLKYFYPRTGDFIAVVGRWKDRHLVRHIKKAFRTSNEMPVQSYTGPPIHGVDLSDHLNYWTNGFAAVMITDTAFIRNPNYHTPRDTAETLDYQRMGAVLNGVACAVVNGDLL